MGTTNPVVARAFRVFSQVRGLNLFRTHSPKVAVQISPRYEENLVPPRSVSC